MAGLLDRRGEPHLGARAANRTAPHGARRAATAAEGGYDVHGDLTGLAPRPSTTHVDDPTQARLALVSDVLADTVAELARLRERHTELELRTAKLQRKRRRRLAAVS